MIDYDTKGWIGVLTRMRGSVLQHVIVRVAVCGALGVAAMVLFETYKAKIPATAHTMLGVALGLLLVFRTNASYDRYWEGRRLLGLIVNRTRDLARQADALITGEDEAAIHARSEVRRFVILYFALLRQYLRAERDLSQISIPLSAQERAELEPIKVRPNVAVAWLSRTLQACVAEGRLSQQSRWLMDLNITSLVDSWGGCERIYKTPIPFAYAQHIKAFLTIFCFSAPFALVESMRWATPVAAALLAFGMFGIEQIGVEIEDPFGYDPNDLPVDAIGETIERDTNDVIRLPRRKPESAA